MEQEEIIEPSVSKWGAPVVLVKKKDSAIRYYVDYHQLNEKTQVYAYLMPRVEDLVDQLGRAKVLTTLDLARGYWQVKVKESAKERTAFTTPYGLYQFKVMPLGLNGAPATFQQLMDKVMRGTETYVGVYMDDVVVYSDSWENHVRHLREVLERLRAAGLTAKLSKCQLGMSHCYWWWGGQAKPKEGVCLEGIPNPTDKEAGTGISRTQWILEEIYPWLLGCSSRVDRPGEEK